MRDALDRLAERLAYDPLFFSFYLRLHCEALGLDWQGQAIRLGVSREKAH